MINWEKKIIEAFIRNYFSSVPATKDNRSILRLRSSKLFPDFDTASPDEKNSFLEAAESLEKKGLVQLRWEEKKERLKTLSCENFEKLFEEAGRPFPKSEAEEIRAMLGTKKEIAFLEAISHSFSPREIGQGLNRQIIEDLIRLLEFCSIPSKTEGITTRALSIQLYQNSKYLENLLDLCKPLLTRVGKTIPMPDFSFLERSYPETMISGKIIIEYKKEKTPLINSGAHILGIPLENAEEINTIKPVSEKNEKTVLTIENKETFYALAGPGIHTRDKNFLNFECYLYIGGYFNRATASLIKTLAASDFSFYHAGDLDPDGILILQHIQDLAQRPVVPVRMDAATFDQYCAWARPLTKPMLRQIVKIREETRAIPGLADLLQRIKDTGLGVEQEIVDYR